MEYDEVLRLQKQLYRLHRMIYSLIIFCCVFQLFQFKLNNLRCIICIVSVCFLFLVDFLTSLEKPISEKYVIYMLRTQKYLQYLFALFMFENSNTFFQFGLFLILLCLFLVEILLVSDFTEQYHMFAWYVAIGVPLFGMSMFSPIVHCNNQFSIYQKTIIALVLMVIYITGGTLFSKFYRCYKERIYREKRKFYRIHDANAELRIEQEKVKKVNELLGVQKVKLQAANKLIQKAHSETLIQYEIISSISASLEIHKLMNLICTLLLNKMDVDLVALWVNQEDEFRTDHLFEIQTTFGNEFQDLFSKVVKSQGLDYFFEDNKVYIDNNAKESQYPFSHLKKIGSLLIIPMVQQKNKFGYLFVGHRIQNSFRDNIAFYETIVGQLLVALNNASLYSKVEEMAKRDGLTGIYNRRHLSLLFQEESDKAKRNNQSLSLALFDIDKFKLINDRYGHQLGDQVIIAVAKEAQQFAEKNHGIAARYGGEEFVILLPEVGIKEAYKLSKDLLDNVKKLEFETKGNIVKVAVSVGITTYPDTCSEPSEMFSRADFAMYHSKENGRSQITIDQYEKILKI